MKITMHVLIYLLSGSCLTADKGDFRSLESVHEAAEGYMKDAEKGFFLRSDHSYRFIPLSSVAYIDFNFTDETE